MNKITNNKPFSENIKWLFIGTILTNIITIAISIFIIRTLKVDEFGVCGLDRFMAFGDKMRVGFK